VTITFWHRYECQLSAKYSHMSTWILLPSSLIRVVQTLINAFHDIGALQIIPHPCACIFRCPPWHVSMSNYNKYKIWQYALWWLTIRNDSPRKCRYNALYESPFLVTIRGLVFILYVYVTILLRIHDILIHSFTDRKVQWYGMILRNRTKFPTVSLWP
jgi:hypothetical protein